jgi:hypothetical protein
MHPFGACRPDSGEHEADPASAASGVFSKGGFVMACDGIYVRLNSSRDLCVPLYLAAQQRRADAETDPDDDDERAVRDLIGVAAIMRIASELFDGELPDGIRGAVRKGVIARYAREQPDETRLGEAIAEAGG